MFISAMYSCRSGYGKSSSEELMDIMKTYIKKRKKRKTKGYIKNTTITAFQGLFLVRKIFK